ncbi:tRNA threonylcarbamoyladenosine biosynthesis protein TsaB [Jeotgalibaca dankookensis]|uniref:tRNA threonylcarbamoyladenosine biosynthesis protein TsaB n=1 Tax=Jeotgalibaca dankookensis TaxID=708126 RepID=A0A1S6IS60_9LACT|nr:tRNA (adenosine(37)-N6)-threonylcarbamoyltransferase complex dimerization subunit type 1 TsaB [Jeotgalibaca dankookensis]AQS54386.1 tRNA threonylcarbamoyladenosine biosynthesis protein TsaB [Jeotgalibaca dankookensis]
MKILAIESSNQTMSVATLDEGLLVAEYTTNGNLQHSTQLMPAIEHILNGSNWQPSNLDRIVVTKGPGSYTGIRIGVTIAKTMAWSLNKPLIAVSSLKLIASNASYFQGLIVPLIDARRKNVYAGVYRVEDTVLTEVMPDQHLPSERLFQLLKEEKQPLLFIGQDVLTFKEDITNALGEQAIIANQKDWLPRASNLVTLALTEEVVDAHLFTPEYLKKPEAEENWQKANASKQKGEYVERID